jgi:ribosomal protein S18 acetylase RimI-like enzyme
MSGNTGLIRKQLLTNADLDEIKQLAQICDAHDGATLRFNWATLAARPADETNDFFYYQDGALVGCLSLYTFGGGEAEASGMVHPEHRRRGIFRSLLAVASAELQRRGIPNLLFFCDARSDTGIAFLKALGAQYDHSEYRMDLAEPQAPPACDERLRVERAEKEDSAAVAHIIGLCFGAPEEEVLSGIAKTIDNPAHPHLIGRLDGVPIGALSMIAGEQKVGIFGFGVLPEYRGRGYGRQILAQTIAYASATYQKPIFLEVVPENKGALGLYQSLGFQETSRYEYYQLAVADPPAG